MALVLCSGLAWLDLTGFVFFLCVFFAACVAVGWASLERVCAELLDMMVVQWSGVKCIGWMD